MLQIYSIKMLISFREMNYITDYHLLGSRYNINVNPYNIMYG